MIHAQHTWKYYDLAGCCVFVLNPVSGTSFLAVLHVLQPSESEVCLLLGPLLFPVAFLKKKILVRWASFFTAVVETCEAVILANDLKDDEQRSINGMMFFHWNWWVWQRRDFFYIYILLEAETYFYRRRWSRTTVDCVILPWLHLTACYALHVPVKWKLFSLNRAGICPHTRLIAMSFSTKCRSLKASSHF